MITVMKWSIVVVSIKCFTSSIKKISSVVRIRIKGTEGMEGNGGNRGKSEKIEKREAREYLKVILMGSFSSSDCP